MLWVCCIAARLAPVLRRTLPGAFGVALLVVAAPEPTGGFRSAAAALVIHTPDGRPVTPLGLADNDQRPLYLATDREGLAVQLAAADVLLYRRIFAAQEIGAWDEADALLASLHDRRLVGEVSRQRLLHPDRKARYDELADWLERFSDHAGAELIHTLALRRQPPGARAPRLPSGEARVRFNGALERLGGSRPERDEMMSLLGEDEEERLSVAPRSRVHTRAHDGADFFVRLGALLRAGRTGPALALLGSAEAERGLDAVQYDAARARVAASLYYAGQIRDAQALASASAARSGSVVPLGPWIAGLASWRLGQMERAGRHFEAAAKGAALAPWLRAAAAYWAARVDFAAGRIEAGETRLAEAARFPHTFYGLIAGRRLGRAVPIEWRLPELTGAHLRALARTKPGARAIALFQVGQIEAAGAELRHVAPAGDHLAEQALLVLADRAGLAELTLAMGNTIGAADGAPFDAALFPLPHWRPRDGFTLDRALVFAVMRQESRFDPRSLSPAGASGLMQIIPATAQHVRQRNPDISGKEVERDQLFDPATNLTLGQRYLGELMATPEIGPNLFLATAAYNAGPGALGRWKREMEEVADPLLFIESMPYAETRDYVQKVLANFWLYRLRLGQETTSLDAVAADAWPIYLPVEVRATEVAQRSRD